jgi:hypothetical protein
MSAEAEMCLRVKEYVKKRVDGIVDEACRKRVMDLTTVAVSVMSSTVIPFSGVAVVVAATVIQCLNFAITLGLIPLLNLRSVNDLVAMSRQIGSSIKRAGKSSLMAGVEAAVLETLKHLGLGDWLWTEVLQGILFEMIGESAMDAAWIMTPLLAAPKYMMHRHLIKKMYRKLGDKAEIVHTKWAEQNCVIQVGAQTTVITQVAGGVQVDAYGNVQGAYVQTQEVCTTLQTASNNDAQASQTNGYLPQPQMPPASDANFFQFQPAVNPTSTIIVGYTPPVNSSFFQPQLRAKSTGPTLIMGYTPPANSSFFQPQTGGQFQP